METENPLGKQPSIHKKQPQKLPVVVVICMGLRQSGGSGERKMAGRATLNFQNVIQWKHMCERALTNLIGRKNTCH